MSTTVINRFTGMISDWTAPKAFLAHWNIDRYLTLEVQEEVIPTQQNQIYADTYWFPLTQAQFDNWEHYDWEFDRAAGTLTLTWVDDTLDRLHGSNELMELEDALVDRSYDQNTILQGIGTALTNIVAYINSTDSEKPGIARRLNSQVSDVNTQINNLSESRSANVIEYNEFLHRLIISYAVGLGSGRRWNNVNKARAVEVACFACEQYWALGSNTDSDGLVRKTATWLDPRSRVAPTRRSPQLTRSDAMRKAEIAIKRFAESDSESNWKERKHDLYERGEIPRIVLQDAAKTLLVRNIKDADESRRDPAAPDAIDDLAVVISAGRPATATLTWTLPNDGGSTITRIEVEYADANTPGSEVITRLAADTLTHDISGLAAGTWVFKVRAVNALGDGDWDSEQVVI